MKLPNLKDLRALCADVKAQISDEYRADVDDEIPGICLTVGADDTGNWSYQTGDNSYTGGAYHYPHWAVVSVYRNSNCLNLARDIQDQLADLIAESESVAEATS